MKIDISMCKKENNIRTKLIWRCCLLAVFLLAGTGYSSAQQTDSLVVDEENKPQAR